MCGIALQFDRGSYYHADDVACAAFLPVVSDTWSKSATATEAAWYVRNVTSRFVARSIVVERSWRV